MIDRAVLFVGRLAVDVVVMDFHVKAARALRQGLANFAKAIDAKLLAIQTLTDKLQRRPASPRARADHGFAFACTPR